MRKLIPIILICLGIGAGIAAGIILRPDIETAEDTDAEARETPQVQVAGEVSRGIVEFSSQFMVPLVADNRVSSVMILGLALEIDESKRDMASANLLRTRDALLQVLFDHADAGGFSGAFTSQASLGPLRRALLEAAQITLGRDVVFSILITEVMRTGA